MNRQQALSLLEEYRDHAGSVLCDPAVTDMKNRWPDDGSERKSMRWVGFMAGVLYQAGVFSLEEIKDHFRRGTMKDTV